MPSRKPRPNSATSQGGDSPDPELGPISRVLSKQRRQTATGWRAVWTEVSLDVELMILIGVLVALCLWFAITGAIRTPDTSGRRAAILPLTDLSDRFAFVRHPDLLAEVKPIPEARSPTPTAGPAPDPAAEPLQTASVEQHSLVAEPIFDPLASVVLSGLPKSAHLSAGTSLSPTDWAVTLGDLDNLVIRLPAERSGPIRTTLDLRTRAGVRIHSFTVELQQEEPARTAVAPPANTAPRKIKPSPAKAGGEKALRPVKKIARKAAVVVPAKAIPAAKPIPAAPPLPAPAPVTVPPPSTSAGPPGLFSVLPFGLFAPDPKDSAASGLTPDLRDDPRFTTLRGLGVKPTDTPPEPVPEAP